MALTQTAREAERERIARHVLDLVKERGSEIAWSVAMAESGLTRQACATRRRDRRPDRDGAESPGGEDRDPDERSDANPTSTPDMAELWPKGLPTRATGSPALRRS